ncbi:hypothetical protein TRFO_41309 [Tritrichomonas foetus]|uniref:Uncharacterized protein n=1 Tax=Tritrichomonas foetus TaxID=1144522 RepID=A0A1J4L568_9EUKA|nr:hypothetical protein TRFO_41309 [Tritrichomonas foetus]|eukprot:OHT17078.1 hypothetical protein TRFO_41309 [Tritrichomonas foetus]
MIIIERKSCICFDFYFSREKSLNLNVYEMKPVNITSYLQRPVDSYKEPIRAPITEWEYDEIHAGEKPKTGNTSSDSSDLYEFSVSSNSYSQNDDDLLDLCHPAQFNEPDLLNADPNRAGKALKGDLDFLASAHFRSEDRKKKQKDATNATLSTFKYTYFDDIPDEETQSNLPKLSSGVSDFISSNSPPKSSYQSSELPKGSFKKNSNQSRQSTLTGKSSTDLLKSSTSEYNPEKSLEISKRTASLREKKSPKNLKNSVLSKGSKRNTLSEFVISSDDDDDEFDILKSSSSTIKNLKSPVKPEIRQKTSQLREERKPKPKEESSSDDFYLETNQSDIQNDHNNQTANQLTSRSKAKELNKIDTLNDFEISEDDELEKSIERTMKSTIDKPKVEFYATGTTGMDCIDTEELLKPVSSFSSAKISQEQYDRLNRSKKFDNDDENTLNKKGQMTGTSTLKSFSKNDSTIDNKNSKYEANPPSMFSKYIEEHPPPPKPKDDTPTKFTYKVKPLKNDAPSMYQNQPPQPPKKVEFDQSTKIAYRPAEVIDNPPSFLTETDRNKKKRKPVTFEQDPLKEFELEPDEEKVLENHRRRKMIEDRVNGPSDQHQNNTKKQLSPQQKEKLKKQQEREKKMFYDPAETQASKLRNQRIRQKLALKHEQERILEEAEVDRLRREQEVYLQIEPELRRLAKISKERQGSSKKFTGRANNPKSVESLQNALKKVEETEVLIRRSDRSLILKDVMNKRVKDNRERQKQDETRALELGKDQFLEKINSWKR